MVKSNIAAQERGFFVALSGNDDLDGKTIERAKATTQAAIDAAVALDPVPGVGATAAVTASSGGNFTEGFEMADWVFMRFEDVTANNSDLVTVEAASFCNLVGGTLTNSRTDGVLFNIDGQKSFGLEMLYNSTSGNDGIIYNIKGICESIFIQCSDNQLIGDNSIAYNFTGQADDLMYFNANQIFLLGDGCKGIVWNPSNAGEGVANISAIVIERCFKIL